METNAKNVILDLRRLNSAFITNIKSQATGVTKRVVCIPIDDNFVEESGYTDRNGREIRTAKMQLKMWPVSDESRQQFGKKNDYELRLDISKHALESLAQRDPEQHARLDYSNNAYDRELAKQLLPYVGQAYEVVSRDLPLEQTGTVTVEQVEGKKDDDLPF